MRAAARRRRLDHAMFAAEVEARGPAGRVLSPGGRAYSCGLVRALDARKLVKALAAVLAGLAAASATPVAAAPVDAGHLKAELVAQETAVAPGGTVYVALRQKIEPGWHTYWRNPGDSGQATSLTWTLPQGWRAGDMVWPTPQRLRTGPLMDFGYSGEVLLPVALSVPASAAPGQAVTLKAHAAFLVCKDICVPADADLALELPVIAGGGGPDPAWGARIASTLADAPRPGALKATMSLEGQSLRLSVTGPAATGPGQAEAYFFPYDSAAIDHAQPQAIERGPAGLTLILTPGSALKSGPPPSSLSGVLSLGDRAYEITATAGPPLAGAAGLGPPAAPQGPAALARRFGLAVAFAFLGGVILNLMPCVFPILSMKAAALARHAHHPGAARGQGIAFAAGVVAAFLGLAALLIAARAAGQAVGWGFQLQSPVVLALLSLLMLLVALNLSGVFEVGARLQALAGAAPGADQEGPWGAVLTGALAVAVAAPCSAPFMASAIGFALTQNAGEALAVFAALGLGMAAPFTALAFAPGLLARLPRPGPWMDGLRKVLAFPMYATAAWLLWVLALRAGPAKLAELLAALVLTAFAAWAYGAGQRARIAGRAPWAGFGAAGLAAALGLTAALWPVAEAAEVVSQPYAPATLAALRAEGRPVFVNFTAAWCVTCQVNEKVALSGRRVAAAFRRDGVVYLVGDWTRRDADIAGALAGHGRAGVPLYLMYGAGGREAEVLPQLLTEGMVVEAADRAASRS
jgi:thiol:disulfide interchange protein